MSQQFYINPFYFQSTLPATSDTYVPRQADEDLYAGLKAGQSCYVLNSRQMGKSSLMIRVSERLEADDVRCAILDLSLKQKTGAVSAQWYGDLVNELAEELDLEIDVQAWKQEEEWLSPLGRFQHYLRTVVLAQIQEPVVIFIDEIDSVLSLEFSTDDLFAFIRGCHNNRVRNRIYERLTFCLIGVADPAELIEDKKLTPFNIGQAIDLQPLAVEDALPKWGPLLPCKLDCSEQIIQTIFEWTNGQPFLSQRVCGEVFDYLAQDNPNTVQTQNVKAWVEQIVEQQVLTNWEINDKPVHLKTIRARLEATSQESSKPLEVYGQVLQKNHIVADGSPEQLALLLTGAVVVDRTTQSLQVFNPIYTQIFHWQWVQEQLDKVRPFATELNAWIASENNVTSFLLQGKALDDALIWASNRTLSREESRFLSESQSSATQIAREEADAANEAKAILATAREQAEQQLTETQREVEQIQAEAERSLAAVETKAEVAEKRAGAAAKRLTWSVAALIVSVASAIGVWVITQQSVRVAKWERYVAEETTEIELLADRSLDQFEKNQFSGLLAAVKACRKLQFLISEIENQKRTNTTIKLSQYPTIKPYLNLSKILSEIFEYHRLETHTAEVNFASFSPDGERVVTASNDGTAQLWNLADGTSTALVEHTAAARQALFSSDGRQLVTTFNDGMVQIKDLENEVTRVWTEHTDTINDVSFSDDNRYLVTASDDGTARIKHLAEGTSLIIDGHGSRVTSASFSHDAEQLVTITAHADYDGGTARVWNLAEGTFNIIEGHDTVEMSGHLTRRDTVFNASFSPNGEQLLTASEDGTARVWNLMNDTSVILGGGHFGGVPNASFSSNGEKVVTVGGKNAQVWKLYDETITLLQLQSYAGAVLDPSILEGHLRDRPIFSSSVLEGHTGDINDASFSSNGEKVVTASDDGTARVWDLSEDRSLTLKGHTDVLNSALFSADGENVVTASDDGTVRVWDLSGNTHKLLDIDLSLQGFLVSDAVSTERIRPTFSPDSRKVVVVEYENVHIWDLFSGQSLLLEGHTDQVAQALFDTQSRRLLTTSFDNTARVWDVESGQSMVLEGHTDMVTDACFSPDEQNVVTTSLDGDVRIWDLASSQSIVLGEQEAVVTCAAFSSDGKYVVTASNNGEVKIWDLLSGKSKIFEGHTRPIVGVSFTPDGKYLVTAADNEIRMWSINGKETVTLSGRFGRSVHPTAFDSEGEQVLLAADADFRVWDLRTTPPMDLTVRDPSFRTPLRSAFFSPNGKYVLSVSINETVRLWDLDDKTSVSIGEQIGSDISVAFSPDGERIATGSFDGIVEIWDISGRKLQQFESVGQGLEDVRFSPNGDFLMINTFDSLQVRFVHDLDSLLEKACERLGAYLQSSSEVKAEDKLICDGIEK